MSRLTVSDIENIIHEFKCLEDTFIAATGCTMSEIAARAAGINYKTRAWENLYFSVVPITSGEGIISGFSETLSGIIKHMGCKVKITKNTDILGIYESYQSGGCQMYADDDTFIAYNMTNGKVAENGIATGYGFAEALALAAKDVKGKEVLIMGAGPVGCAAADYLFKLGAQIVIFDIDENKLKDLEGKSYEIIRHLGKRKFSLIIEATNSSNTIDIENVNDDAIISAPGMPLGISDALMNQLKMTNRVIHNPLELGTAVMLMMVV